MKTNIITNFETVLNYMKENVNNLTDAKLKEETNEFLTAYNALTENNCFTTKELLIINDELSYNYYFEGGNIDTMLTNMVEKIESGKLSQSELIDLYGEFLGTFEEIKETDQNVSYLGDYDQLSEMVLESFPPEVGEFIEKFSYCIDFDKLNDLITEDIILNSIEVDGKYFEIW